MRHAGIFTPDSMTYIRHTTLHVTNGDVNCFNALVLIILRYKHVIGNVCDLHFTV